MENIIAQISTHKAVIKNDVINIVLKGIHINEELSWADELLYTMPIDCKDDVFAIMEDFEDNNRFNLSEFNYF